MQQTKFLSKLKAFCRKAQALGKKVWQGLRLAAREVGNTLTNVLVPVLSVACAMSEALQLPVGVVAKLKQTEHKLFLACGTAHIINDYLDKMEQAISEGQKEGRV